MRSASARVRLVWFRVLLAAGTLLAVTMLAQTVLGYYYITGNLLLQQGRVEGQRIVRELEEGLRTPGASGTAALSSSLDSVWRGLSPAAAWIVVVDDQNQVLAARGRDRPSFTPADRQRSLDAPEPTARFESTPQGRVVVAVFPCRCATGSRRPARGDGGRSDAPGVDTPPLRRGPIVVEMGLNPSGLSAPFSRVRRQAALNALTACALIGALVALGFRFRSYIQGKQVEAHLEAARRVQRELVAVTDARIPGVEIAAECTPALHVGGDLVDVLPLPRGRIGFMLGDVSGKGVSAALLMGLVQGAVCATAAGFGSDAPEQAMADVNDLLVRKTSGDRFASLFWCSFDRADATLRYVNAGHPPAFLVRARVRVVEALTEGGPVLGVIDGAPYQSGRVTVAPGDLLVVFSDGIAEATDLRDEEFGAARITEAVATYGTMSARGICDAVLASVERFADPAGARDDRTLLVVRFTTECAVSPHQKQGAPLSAGLS